VHVLDVAALRWTRVAVRGGADLVPVRHTATAAHGRLLLIGGGAFCFSFGTAFSPPAALDVRRLLRVRRADARPAAPGLSICAASGAGGPRPGGDGTDRQTAPGLQGAAAGAAAASGAQLEWALVAPRLQARVAKEEAR
jgi:hypothetical protein